MKIKNLALTLALTSPAVFADEVLFMNCFDTANNGGPALEFYHQGLNAEGSLNIRAVVATPGSAPVAFQGTGQRKGLLKFRATFGTEAGTRFGEAGIMDVAFSGKSVVESDGAKAFLGTTSFDNRSYECHLNIERLKQQPAAPAQPQPQPQPAPTTPVLTPTPTPAPMPTPAPSPIQTPVQAPIGSAIQE